MMDIIMLVFFVAVANADDWIKIEVFGKEHEKFLRNYPELPYGIPSHDTIQRVFAMVPSEFLENFQKRRKKEWQELKSIILTRNTITEADGKETVEERDFISSLATDCRRDRESSEGHWIQAVYNLNIIRKPALNILKITEVGRRRLCMKKKRYAIGTNPEKYPDELMNL